MIRMKPSPPEEFNAKALRIMKEHGFELSRMISFSKSTYVSRHPNHRAVFNANVITARGKIWWGDLDLADDSEKLQQVANILDCNIYILREMDYRFDTENRPFDEVEKLAVKTFAPTASTPISKPALKSFLQCLHSLVSRGARFLSAIPKR
jgi:hypothetical protein